MKKIIISFLLLLIVHQVLGKTTIKGTVVSTQNTPIVEASVYVNYTTISTFSDEKGNFELTVDDENADIIISFKGFVAVKVSVTAFDAHSIKTIRLLPKETPTSKISKAVRAYNFEIFNELFLGKTIFSKRCTIKNPEVLHFSFDVSAGYLKVSTTEPLIIENKDLGYFIYYDLIEFESTSKGTKYNGYAKFVEVSVDKMLQRRIDKNRKRAYNGSQIHFFRALQEDHLEEEGFFIDQYKRFPNPERPSEKTLHKARIKVMENFSSITYLKEIKHPKTALDSAIVTLRKVSLHTQIEELVKKKVTYFDMIEKSDVNTYLKFSNYLKIYYTKEGEEVGFYKSIYADRKREQGYQITNIKLLSSKEKLNKNGTLQNPLHLLIDGYWAFERIADKLPLNYHP